MLLKNPFKYKQNIEQPEENTQRIYALKQQLFSDKLNINIKMILNHTETSTSILENLLFQQLKALLKPSNQQYSQTNLALSSNFQNICDASYILNEYRMIEKQSEFLEIIKSEITNKQKTLHHQILICENSPNNDIIPIESSFDISSINSTQLQDDEIFRTKFSQEYQGSLLISVLHQIKQLCSQETYQTIKKYTLSNKEKQFSQLCEKYDNLLKKHEELQINFIIKSTKLVQLQSQLKDALGKIDQLDEQKKKFKIKMNQLSEKERRVYSLESAIVFKQKMLNQGRKRYEKQKNVFISIKDRVNKLYKEMENIWELVCSKMQQIKTIGCLIEFQEQGKCWKKQIMRKCKQQLFQQRKLLKQQEDEIQKQFQIISLLSDQVKKLINDQKTIALSNQSMSLNQYNL